MTYRHFWLGTALLALMIGSGASAHAQYYSPYKPDDKPAVEVDMSVLGDANDAAPVAAAPTDPETTAEIDQEPLAPEAVLKPSKAAHHATRVADYKYIRPALETDLPPPPAPTPAPVMTPAAPVAAPALMPSEPPAPAPAKLAKKKKLKKTTEKAPIKPSLVTTSAPEPQPPAKPAGAPIVSMPPAMEAAPVLTEHHDIHTAAPIISSSPDAAPPAAAAPPTAQPAPVPAFMNTPEAPVAAPGPVMAEPAPAPVVNHPVVAAPSAGPSPVPEHMALPPAEPPVAVETPRENDTGASIPDIKVVHPADYPEDSEPAPEPEISKPREQPLPLPKVKKPGKTTADMLAPAPVHPAPEAAPAPVPPEDAVAAPVAPVAPAPQPEATAAAPDTQPPADSMPTVPTIADLTLNFSGNSSDLTPETQKKLDAVIRQMGEMTDGRLQVRGFATGEDGSKSSARRIALSRVLSVRSYLMDKGVKPTRVDVRAMGTETDRSPMDRVDLIFVR